VVVEEVVVVEVVVVEVVEEGGLLIPRNHHSYK